MDFEQILTTINNLMDEHAWILQVFFVVFFTLLADYIIKRLINKLESKVINTKNTWDDAFFYAIRKPVRFLIWVMGVSFAVLMVDFEADSSIQNITVMARYLGVITALTWFLIRLVKGIELNIVRRYADADQPMDKTTVDAIGKLAKASIFITAVLVSLQTLGVNVTGILTFGGIGGLAVGLAAKDLLANFFGGLTVYLDRPFAVGDWVKSPDRSIEGTVEHIGWRQTCIRKFDKRPIYVPNSIFTTIAIENPSRMTHRRIYETLSVRYLDAKKVPEILTAIKAMLQQHEDIDQTQTLMVYFNSFADSSLDFFIYTFTKTTDWSEYHRVKQDVLLQIEKIVESHGAEFAFPTSTIHVAEPIAIVND